MYKFLLTIAGLIFLSSCSNDSCRSYSDYTCSELENSSYEVYVWYSPSEWGDDPTYLGTSGTLSGCRSMANNTYRKIDDYICCLKTKSSSCAEKHR